MSTQVKTKGMCIATRCTSVEQFIQMFHRFVDEESFFVSTLNTRPPGLETSFSVQLADGTPVLRGLCVVMQAWTTPQNPFKTPGVRLGIKRLTANSMAVFERLLVTRSAAKPPPTATQPRALAAVVVAKPGTPKPIEKSPYTETAPARSAPSRVVIEQPARPSTEPRPDSPTANLPPAAPARAVSEPIPEHIPSEPTDVIEEKTEIRDVKSPTAAGLSPAIPPVAASPPSPPAASPPAPPKVLPPKGGLDLAKTLASIGKAPEAAKPGIKPTAKPPVATPPLGVKSPPPVATPPLGVRTAQPVAKPLTDAAKPLTDAAKPLADAAKPLADAAKPDADSVDAKPATTSAPAVQTTAPNAASNAAAPPAPTAPPTRPSSPVDLAKPLATAEPLHDEARTPGSDFVLPANPLMNLTDESLVGYVDCTLYEETGNFFPADDDATFGDDLVAPPTDAASVDGATSTPSPRAETPLPLDKPPQAGERSASSRFESNAETEVAPRRDSAPALHTPPPPGSPVVAAAAATQTANEPPANENQGALAPTATASPLLAQLWSKRPPWWLLGGVGGAAAALVVVLVVVLTSSSDGGTPAPAPAPAPLVKRPAANVAQPAVEEQPTPTNPVEPPTDEADEEVPPPTEGAPTVGSGPCKVVVHSTPASSIVKLDGNTVGPSPLTVAAPCGKHKVDITHPRYAAHSRLVTLAPGKTEDIEVTLSRPTHVVTVTSNPPGAQIFINGRSAGTTPTKLSVLGFVTLKLEFKKTGYQPAATKLYSKRALDNVSVRLTKW